MKITGRDTFTLLVDGHRQVMCVWWICHTDFYQLVSFAAMALLFLPFFKVALGRAVWNVVDVLVAIGLICLIVKTFKKR